MPPAAVMARDVAARTASMAFLSVPCIRPSRVDVGVEELAEEQAPAPARPRQASAPGPSASHECPPGHHVRSSACRRRPRPPARTPDIEVQRVVAEDAESDDPDLSGAALEQAVRRPAIARRRRHDREAVCRQSSPALCPSPLAASRSINWTQGTAPNRQMYPSKKSSVAIARRPPAPAGRHRPP